MPVDPQIKALLEQAAGLPEVHRLSVAEARAMAERRVVLMAPAAPVGAVEERTVAGPAGPMRLRPILMTTLATLGGMLPIAIGIEAGSETQAPLGTVVIGGLITSTALTLVIVPAVFTVLDDIERWVAPKARKLLAESPARPAPEPSV